MAGYVARRLFQAVPILFGVAVISFSLIYLAPGDPIDRFRTPTIRPEQLQGLIRLYGLDKPLPEQFWSWLTTYVQVWRPEAWGYSFLDGQPVLFKIADRLPATLLLGASALALTVVVAIPLGILAAVRQYSVADRLISSLATIGYAIPSFLLGLYLLFFGGVVLGWFPLFGMESFGREGDPLDIGWHLVLPVTSLAVQQIAGWSRYVRAAMLEVLHQDFVRTARAKGLPGRRVTFKHALRNALIPVITLIGLTIPSLLAGAAITEAIFTWPGVGLMGVDAVAQRDYPVVLAFVMIGGIGVVLGNLLADVAYAVADPRIKLG
ncbi:MAG TPA: ABC transporter permease [Candidatus Limnocylindria bacterium]|jgi:peptide/nickel transport system permease protein|nr:ABC transporter permease [Candidatus Limnocylindria bacterium]